MARVKTFSNNGTLLPSDLNSIQDDYDTRIASLVASGGLVTDGSIRRGKSIIAATESRTNVAYGLMTTPDRVAGIVLPTDGLICVAYQATWQESVAAAARAAIFLNAVQARIAPHATNDSGGSAPLLVDAYTGSSGTVNNDAVLHSYGGGLIGESVASAVAYTGDVTTGQIIGAALSDNSYANTQTGTGGWCVIFAAAGTYDISVQFKSSSGSVTVKNRKLWVESRAY